MRASRCLIMACLLASTSEGFGYGMADDSSIAQHRAVRECATCHPAQAKPHPTTSMAHAMELPTESEILKSHRVLTLQIEPYSYRIERQGEQSIYSVSDGRQTISAPIGWAFGLGLAGQTYVYEYNGELYQSRVSFYQAIDNLDVTLGAQNTKPTNLVQAAGLPDVA